jgi:hypothetical protein
MNWITSIFISIGMAFAALFGVHNQPVTNSACVEFDSFSSSVLNTIQRPDSQRDIVNKNVIGNNFEWKRNANESFIGYPILKGVEGDYLGYDEKTGTMIHSGNYPILSMQNDSSLLTASIENLADSFGLAADTLNTIPLQSFSLVGDNDRGYIDVLNASSSVNDDKDYQVFAFHRGNDFYSVVLSFESGEHQAPDQSSIKITCGKAVKQYDDLYDAINPQSDPSTTDRYSDYVQIVSVSPDGKVYELFGNHVDIADYYYFDGTVLKPVSSDSAPITCDKLERQKIGAGMLCYDTPDNVERYAMYSTSTGSTDTISLPLSIDLPRQGQVIQTSGSYGIEWSGFDPKGIDGVFLVGPTLNSPVFLQTVHSGPKDPHTVPWPAPANVPSGNYQIKFSSCDCYSGTFSITGSTITGQPSQSSQYLNFSARPASAPAPVEVNFLIQIATEATGTSFTGYSVDFGDGTIGQPSLICWYDGSGSSCMEALSVKHIYLNPGTYIATLEKNNSVVSTSTIIITANL